MQSEFHHWAIYFKHPSLKTFVSKSGDFYNQFQVIQKRIV